MAQSYSSRPLFYERHMSLLYSGKTRCCRNNGRVVANEEFKPSQLVFDCPSGFSHSLFCL